MTITGRPRALPGPTVSDTDPAAMNIEFDQPSFAPTDAPTGDATVSIVLEKKVFLGNGDCPHGDAEVMDLAPKINKPTELIVGAVDEDAYYCYYFKKEYLRS